MGQLHEILAVIQESKLVEKRMMDEFIKLADGRFYDGFIKTYMPKDEEGETFPTEEVPVVTTVAEKLLFTKNFIIKNIDNLLTVNETNRIAEAELVIDGISYGKYSSTSFLELEKELQKLRTMYASIPTLNLARKWTLSLNEEDIYEAETELTTRKIKQTIHRVIVQATDKFPAQVVGEVTDVPVGVWQTTHKSGRLSPANKAKLLSRIDTLIEAVKKCRAKANQEKICNISLGGKLFDYINKGSI